MCRTARVVLFGVGEGPVLAVQVTQDLPGRRLDEASIWDAAVRVGHDIDPSSDIHASSAYRRHLCGVLVRRTLTRAAERAGAAQA
jgi:carbon-monoxide dehydrogenase medium subunit